MLFFRYLIQDNWLLSTSCIIKAIQYFGILYKMVFMVGNNAKSETQGTWGDQKISRSSTDHNSAQGTKSTSPAARNQPIRTTGANREGRYSIRQCQRNTNFPGGILSQLINETRQQIVENEAQTNKLYQRLQVFESLLNQLEDQEK